MEKWKKIPNTHYEVSSSGRVRNANNGRVIKQQVNQRGYSTIRVKDDNQKKISRTVHRLVALSFVANPNGYKEVNHQDGDKQNNNASNLVWCTRSQNIQHAWDNELRRFTEKVRAAVLKNLEKANTPEVKARRRYPRCKKTICVETGQVFESIKAAADSVGAHEQNIQKCCTSNGKRTSRGFHWEYADNIMEKLTGF